MYKVKQLKSKTTALKIIDFLLSDNAFQQTWAPGEAELVRKAVESSFNSKDNHAYWYVEDNAKIIGAMGVRENDYKSGGYEMNSDYLAVHKDYRRFGIGTMLIKEIEKYVKEKTGRYILIVTCDIDSYKPARAFFEKNGYQKVGAVPNYYVVGEGKIDYLKSFK